MEKQNITISTVPVTIRVVAVGGKKMTLSVFKQIPFAKFLETGLTFDEIEESYLGYIKYDNDCYILYYRGNILYKSLYYRSDYKKQIELYKYEIEGEEENSEEYTQKMETIEEYEYVLEFMDRLTTADKQLYIAI